MSDVLPPIDFHRTLKILGYQFPNSINENREEEIILYCAGGVRSILGCKSLQNMGYKKVFSLKGGIGEWVTAEFPLVSND